MPTIDLREIEKKWRDRWQNEPPRKTVERQAPSAEGSDSAHANRRQNFYCLDMFPYPSTSGLSVNQLRGMVITDVVARYQELRGRNVFRPMGWDSFGLGIENEARENGLSPAEVVKRGVAKMTEQLWEFGARIDWEAEVKTSDPPFYRWTQYLFLKLLERGLADRREVTMKWCPREQSSLANEEVINGRCVHCESLVEERSFWQWLLKITDYADRLHFGLRGLKWPTSVKSMQRHWIGRREGYRLTFKVSSELCYDWGECDVFLRKLEYLPAATYLVLAPEHPLVDQYVDPLYWDDVRVYRERVKRLTERERLASGGEPRGVPTGAVALNPLTLREMPVWVSEAALPHVRFGTILGVPGQIGRHESFAKKFGLGIVTVIAPAAEQLKTGDGKGRRREEDNYQMINCGPFNGLTVFEARKKIRSQLEHRGVLEPYTVYNLRDWVFARQRYWGEPLPILYGETGFQPVDESALPVELPPYRVDLESPAPEEEPELVVREPVPNRLETVNASSASQSANYNNDETWDFFAGEIESQGAAEPLHLPSPLSRRPEFYEVRDPDSGEVWLRETDTMPQWAGSCWYYLRFLDPDNEKAIFEKEKGFRWLPVDLCVGGIEHAILHLLYVRFFAHFLHDLDLTPREEPFRRLFSQGRIFAKTPSAERRRQPHRGDRIEAEHYLKEYGGDALRLHLLFIGPPAEDVVWNEEGLRGTRRFLERSFEFVLDRRAKGRFVSRKVLVEKHRLIRRVTRAIRSFKLNKGVSAFMEFVKILSREPLTPEEVDLATLKTFVTLLAPFAPHTSAELWERLGAEGSVFEQEWPDYSEELLKPPVIEIAIQINSRVRDRLEFEEEPSKTDLIQAALARPRVRELLGGQEPARVIVVPGKLVNLVV